MRTNIKKYTGELPTAPKSTEPPKFLYNSESKLEFPEQPKRSEWVKELLRDMLKFQDQKRISCKNILERINEQWNIKLGKSKKLWEEFKETTSLSN